MRKPEIIITEDGSHTLKIEAIDESYHSTFGAIAESKHVFIDTGLKKLLMNEPGSIDILEVGFGTGLNALLTYLESDGISTQINYTGIEAYPLDAELIEKLNYPDRIEDEEAHDVFKRMHEQKWNETHELGEGFKLTKIQRLFQDYHETGKEYDLVYFDAFAPDVQPELWSEDSFSSISAMMSVGGILVTYSCKGTVKRALKAAGFEIEKLPGPKGKREILRAVRC